MMQRRIATLCSSPFTPPTQKRLDEVLNHKVFQVSTAWVLKGNIHIVSLRQLKLIESTRAGGEVGSPHHFYASDGRSHYHVWKGENISVKWPRVLRVCIVTPFRSLLRRTRSIPSPAISSPRFRLRRRQRWKWTRETKVTKNPFARRRKSPRARLSLID